MCAGGSAAEMSSWWEGVEIETTWTYRDVALVESWSIRSNAGDEGERADGEHRRVRTEARR